MSPAQSTKAAMTKEDQMWKAESDAHALATAEAIRDDPARIKEAKKAAKRLVEQMEERADEQDEQAKAMRKIAKGRFFSYDEEQ